VNSGHKWEGSTIRWSVRFTGPTYSFEVVLLEARWHDHIISPENGHPKIQQFESQIQEAITNPDNIAFEQSDGCVICIKNMEDRPEFPTENLLVLLHPISQSKAFLETAYPISTRRLNRQRRSRQWKKVR